MPAVDDSCGPTFVAAAAFPFFSHLLYPSPYSFSHSLAFRPLILRAPPTRIVQPFGRDGTSTCACGTPIPSWNTGTGTITTRHGGYRSVCLFSHTRVLVFPVAVAVAVAAVLTLVPAVLAILSWLSCTM